MIFFFDSRFPQIDVMIKNENDDLKFWARFLNFLDMIVIWRNRFWSKRLSRSRAPCPNNYPNERKRESWRIIFINFPIWKFNFYQAKSKYRKRPQNNPNLPKIEKFKTKTYFRKAFWASLGDRIEKWIPKKGKIIIFFIFT